MTSSVELADRQDRTTLLDSSYNTSPVYTQSQSAGTNGTLSEHTGINCSGLHADSAADTTPTLISVHLTIYFSLGVGDTVCT